jgi:hypothetical protein
MDIIFYSTDCPKCKILKKKLDSKNLIYSLVDDVDTMLDLGLMSAPALSVDGKLMDFLDAVNFVNSL